MARPCSKVIARWRYADRAYGCRPGKAQAPPGKNNDNIKGTEDGSSHVNAEMGDFADVVLMPGDPLRAKHIAEAFLEDVREVNNVRGMLGFTGTYKGRKISVIDLTPLSRPAPSTPKS